MQNNFIEVPTNTGNCIVMISQIAAVKKNGNACYILVNTGNEHCQIATTDSYEAVKNKISFYVRNT